MSKKISKNFKKMKNSTYFNRILSEEIAELNKKNQCRKNKLNKKNRE